tara:strand:- start:203 stop:811 length:609 start_codon:yes stop_codon:yes gene_type:complete
MTKYKMTKVSEEVPFFYGPPTLFDKPAFEKYRESEDFSKISEEEYFSYVPSGDYGTGKAVRWEEALRVHERSSGDIYCTKELPIKEIFIPTTLYEIEINKLEDVLQLTNYSTNKKLLGNINITKEELIFWYHTSLDRYITFSMKVPNGTLALYGVYDDSYVLNISEQKNTFEIDEESDEFNWSFHDWVNNPPNIHFLYLNFD